VEDISMTDERKQDGPPPNELVPRGSDLEAVRAEIRETHRDERRRRISWMVGTAGGWLVAGLMTVVATGCLAAIIRRPVPQDRMHIAFVYGEHAEATPVEDLSETRREVVLRNTLKGYLRARMEYVWQLQKRNYAIVSAMSSRDIRQQYQEAVWNEKTPGHPHVVYGNTPEAGTALIEQVTIRRDKRSPYSATAAFLLHQVIPNRPVQDVRMTATFAWGDAGPGDVPIDIQEEYDPLNLVITGFDAWPDPVSP
jgi:hypothetical protein